MKRKKILIYTCSLWTLFSVTTPIFSNEVTSSNEEAAPAHLLFQDSEQEVFSLENVEDPTDGPTAIENPLITGETIIHQSTSSTYDEDAFSATARSSQQMFIQSIASDAQQLAHKNDLYASVMIAQAIVESGWGKSTLASYPNHNLFGIKGNYNGQSVTLPTQEYLNGKWVTVQAAFRKYPSYKESLEDNAKILKTTSFQSGVYYYSGAWKSNTKSYTEATAWLTGRYATDPNYESKLNNIIETYNLTKYDSVSSNNSTIYSAMYRLYNRHTGEHFYTLNAAEKNQLAKIGWRYEGIAWSAPNRGTAVYRLYNPNNGDHHYTSNQGEINSLTKIGWRYEGLSFYSGGSKTILRLFNPNAKTGTHHYTAAVNEKNTLVKRGWRYEGVAFHGN